MIVFGMGEQDKCSQGKSGLPRSVDDLKHAVKDKIRRTQADAAAYTHLRVRNPAMPAFCEDRRRAPVGGRQTVGADSG